MAEGDDHHYEQVVLDGVEDAVVAHPDPETGSALQGTGRGRSGVLRQQTDGAVNPALDCWV